MDDNIRQAWDIAMAQRTPEQLKTIHGLRHWKHVEQFGLSMAEKDSRINKTVVRLFACFHDCKRLSDGRDLQHGPRAAQFLDEIRENVLGWLSDDEFGQLREAVRQHTIQDVSTGDVTVDTCIDADRLDLGRIGMTPDPARMLSVLGKEKAENKQNTIWKRFLSLLS